MKSEKLPKKAKYEACIGALLLGAGGKYQSNIHTGCTTCDIIGVVWTQKRIKMEAASDGTMENNFDNDPITEGNKYHILG